MLPQIQGTLNMMRTSRYNSKLAAYKELKGKFDWNLTPMVPLGTNALISIDSKNQTPLLHITSMDTPPGEAPNTTNYWICLTHC